MPLLPKRFERLKSVLDNRMSDLTVLIENVGKPHNLSAILRTCDAVGVMEIHSVKKGGGIETFNSTAQGSQKWVKVNDYNDSESAIMELKKKGFKLYGTNLDQNSIDYKECSFLEPTAFVFGAEKWGLNSSTIDLMDQSINIPMRGMVQSLNVSVAAAVLLFEALRQREEADIIPRNGEGLNQMDYERKIFEWAYPEVANWCNQEGRSYPELDSKGQITEELPRDVKMRY